jgi:hypothetical protein
VGYDAMYALFWGGELADGNLPDYGIPEAPTPHPLPNAVSGLLSLLGDAVAYDAIVALSYVSLAALVWAVFRLGQTVFSTGAGALAALIVGTSFIFLSRAQASFLDLPFVALVLVAATLEAKRPRRGVAVLALLAAAGLLRPEGWGLAAAYWLYLFPSLGWPRRAALAALGAAPAVIWALGDMIVMGDALFSLTGARETAQTSGFAAAGNRELLGDAAEQLRNILRAPVLAGAAAGLAAALVFARRRAALPAGILVVASALFGLQLVANVPLSDRMLFVPAVMLALFCGFAAFGWRTHERGRARTIWAAAGVALLALLAVTAPNQIDRLDRLDRIGGQIEHAIEDLDDLTRGAALDLGACSPLSAPNYRVAPYLAHFLEISPAHLESAAVREPERGLFVAPTIPDARTLLQSDGGVVPQRTAPPAGFDPVASNASWTLYRSGCPAGR